MFQAKCHIIKMLYTNDLKNVKEKKDLTYLIISQIAKWISVVCRSSIVIVAFTFMPSSLQRNLVIAKSPFLTARIKDVPSNLLSNYWQQIVQIIPCHHYERQHLEHLIQWVLQYHRLYTRKFEPKFELDLVFLWMLHWPGVIWEKFSCDSA